jgi:PPK2 family polyphosphate:nucleotide phosphotransferase
VTSGKAKGGDRARWRLRPGERVNLAKLDPGSTEGAPGDRATTEATLATLSDELFSLQDRLWAEAQRSLLVVLQGMDASGKDGTIKHVFRGVNPQATRVAAFKQPTPEDLSHDFLWRVHGRTPAAGEIGVFNRSHYEDVLVVRVHGLVPESVWRARYDHINAFERLLAGRGTTVVKLFLHISFEEQGRRLNQRLERPDKRWKTRPSDFMERKMWDRYEVAYTEALERTSTDVAPWYVVPADHKWFRNWVVSRVLIETLDAMDPHYPQVPPVELGQQLEHPRAPTASR